MALIENKKARFDYEFLQTFEAGVELYGHEVKSIKESMGSLDGARVVARGGEAFLMGATVSPYQQKNVPKSYDPERARRLLLSKKEIAEVTSAEQKKGLTIIPIKWYNKGHRLKLEVAVARHKKKYDKRAALKERDEKRDIERTLKSEY